MLDFTLHLFFRCSFVIILNTFNTIQRKRKLYLLRPAAEHDVRPLTANDLPAYSIVGIDGLPSEMLLSIIARSFILRRRGRNSVKSIRITSSRNRINVTPIRHLRFLSRRCPDDTPACKLQLYT